MSRPQPRRSSPWKRLLDVVFRASVGPARRPRRPLADDRTYRPRPDLLQSLGGRFD